MELHNAGRTLKCKIGGCGHGGKGDTNRRGGALRLWLVNRFFTRIRKGRDIFVVGGTFVGVLRRDRTSELGNARENSRIRRRQSVLEHRADLIEIGLLRLHVTRESHEHGHIDSVGVVIRLVHNEGDNDEKPSDNRLIGLSDVVLNISLINRRSILTIVSAAVQRRTSVGDEVA